MQEAGASCYSRLRRGEVPVKQQQCFSTIITNPQLIKMKPSNFRRSPIIVEFANPAVPVVDIARAITSGMNIVKFRMAYTTKTEKINMMSKVDKACTLSAEKAGQPNRFLATCMAIKTFIKKTGMLDSRYEQDNYIPIKTDSEIILTCDKSQMEHCSQDKIFVNYENLASDVKVGMDITIGTNGKIKTQCTKILNSNAVKCKVLRGGKLESLMTVHIRNFKHTIPCMSKIDINFLKFAVQYQVDMLIVFYSHSGKMIQKVKHYISKAKEKPHIFGGICDQEGLDNIDEIIRECDGIVFCRDYLSLELDRSKIYRVSVLQKWIAAKCKQAGKPVFLSGSLENVITYGTFSDADIFDASNAVLDGITGFILRECFDIESTLIALEGLNEICCQTEPLLTVRNEFWRIMKEIKLPVNAAEAAAMSCAAAANQTKARVIIVPTSSGRTARLLLWLQPSCIVITVCSSARVARSLAACRNVYPILSNSYSSRNWNKREDSKVLQGANFAVVEQWLEYGDIYVSLQRSADNIVFCDTVKVWKVDFSKKHLVECPDEYHRDDVPIHSPHHEDSESIISSGIFN